jgi:CRISPR type IV-associated protein Csf3
MSYKVVIELGSPVILYNYTTLDGILSWCMAQDLKAKDMLKDYDSFLSSLPIEKVAFGNSYFYKSSCWFLDYGVAAPTFESMINRLFPFERAMSYVKNLKSNIDTSRGVDKNYILSYYPISVNRLNFVFDGDESEVSRLLKTWLKSVGKKASAGFGTVKSIDMGASDEDPVLFNDSSARRPIPLEAAQIVGVKKGLERTAVVAYRPPYAPFSRRTQAVCVVPDRERKITERRNA